MGFIMSWEGCGVGVLWLDAPPHRAGQLLCRCLLRSDNRDSNILKSELET